MSQERSLNSPVPVRSFSRELPPTEGYLLLVGALLLVVPFLFQFARQLVHARRPGRVAGVPRHPLGLIYLPFKGSDFDRGVLKHYDEAGTTPKFHIVTVHHGLGIFSGFGVIGAN